MASFQGIFSDILQLDGGEIRPGDVPASGESGCASVRERRFAVSLVSSQPQKW